MPAPLGNDNAEKWNKERCLEVFSSIIKLLKENKWESMGGEEVFNTIITESMLKVHAKNIFGLPIRTYEYLLQDKFKDDVDLRDIKKEIESILEERVMSSKKMYPGIAAMTLKNKHGWRDEKQLDHTTKGEAIQVTTYADSN